jgi:hypothetical protein
MAGDAPHNTGIYKPSRDVNDAAIVAGGFQSFWPEHKGLRVVLDPSNETARTKILRTVLDRLNGTRVACAALSSQADKNGFPHRALPGERVRRHICRR